MAFTDYYTSGKKYLRTKFGDEFDGQYVYWPEIKSVNSYDELSEAAEFRHHSNNIKKLNKVAANDVLDSILMDLYLKENSCNIRHFHPETFGINKKPWWRFEPNSCSELKDRISEKLIKLQPKT